MGLRTRVFAGLSAVGFGILLYLQLSPSVDPRAADGIGCAIGSVMAIGAAIATQVEWSRSRRAARAAAATPPPRDDPATPDDSEAPNPGTASSGH